MQTYAEFKLACKVFLSLDFKKTKTYWVSSHKGIRCKITTDEIWAIDYGSDHTPKIPAYIVIPYQEAFDLLVSHLREINQ